MARKAWAMLAVVTGGLTLSVVSASMSNTKQSTEPAAGEISQLRALVEDANADVAAMREQIRLMELDLQTLRAELAGPDRSEHPAVGEDAS